MFAWTKQVRFPGLIGLRFSVDPEGRVENSPGQAKRGLGNAKSRDETAP